MKGEKTTDELAFPDVNNFLYTSPTVEQPLTVNLYALVLLMNAISGRIQIHL